MSAEAVGLMIGGFIGGSLAILGYLLYEGWKDRRARRKAPTPPWFSGF